MTVPVTPNARPAKSGLFLCAESDEAFFSPAFFKLGSDPVKAASDLTAIVCVLVTVESFQEEHPLISAEVNGLSGLGHEWAACGLLEWSVL